LIKQGEILAMMFCCAFINPRKTSCIISREETLILRDHYHIYNL